VYRVQCISTVHCRIKKYVRTLAFRQEERIFFQRSSCRLRASSCRRPINFCFSVCNSSLSRIVGLICCLMHCSGWILFVWVTVVGDDDGWCIHTDAWIPLFLCSLYSHDSRLTTHDSRLTHESKPLKKKKKEEGERETRKKCRWIGWIKWQKNDNS